MFFIWCGRWDLNPQGSNIHRSLRPARLPVPPHPHIKFTIVIITFWQKKVNVKLINPYKFLACRDLFFGLRFFATLRMTSLFCCICFFYWCFGNCFKFFLFLALFFFCYESVASCNKTRKNEQDKKYCRKCTD